jgi:hypothetical protein
VPIRRFQSWEEVCALVAHFEIGDLPHAQWNHAAHLTVAFWYLSRLDMAQATERIRSGILHYNDCQGTANTDHSGYHETLTRFWIGVVVKFLREADPGQSGLDGVNQLVETYAGRSGLWREYYGFDLIRSVESRRRWIEPDRKAL